MAKETKNKIVDIKETQTKNALELVKENMRGYGIYIAQGRSYPCIYDGLKSSYKRAIYGMYLNNKHQIVKVAELAAFALPYHPHPTSISSVIVSLGDDGNKLKLMKTQGNWGDSSKKVEPSADRYIGGYLPTLSENLMCDSVEYCNYVKGEIDKDEPEALPVYLPICFINGLSGIPSGLPTLNIPTLDIDDMIDYYIDILNHKDLNYKPKKYPMPNMEINIVSSKADWNNVMETGKGSIKTAPIMEIDDKGKITITALPGAKDIENVQKIIEKELLLEKIDILDETADKLKITIERVPHKQCDMKEIYNRLYNKLQSSENINMAFFDSEKIYVPCGFNKVVRSNLEYLIRTHKNRIAHQLVDLNKKLKVLEIVADLRSSNAVKKLAEFTCDEAEQFIMTKYKVDEEIASKVFQKPLSYLTKEHDQEIEDLKNQIIELENDDKDIYEYLIKKYKELKKEIDKVIKDRFIPTKFLK